MVARPSDRYYYIEEPNTPSLLYEELEGLKIQKTDGEKQILGLNCKRALAILDDSLHTTFEIYYTDEIDIDDPNAQTPFAEIDGVMLEFTSLINGVRMHFLAGSIAADSISDNEFVIPPDYKQVSRSEMVDIINE